MDLEVIGWAVFWLTFGLLPIIVAVRRLSSGKLFRAINKWIIAAGLGQIVLPLAGMGLLAVGFPPVFANRAESSFRFVFYIWAADFIAMWVLFIALGIVCRARPGTSVMDHPPASSSGAGRRAK